MTTGEGDLFFRFSFGPVPARGRRGRGLSQLSHFSEMEKALFLLSCAGLGGGVPLTVEEKLYRPSNRSFAFDTELWLEAGKGIRLALMFAVFVSWLGM